MTGRFWSMVAVISMVVMGCIPPRSCASPSHAPDKEYLARVETKIRQLMGAVETLQEDIVDEASGVKEKQLFHKVDQVLHELLKMADLVAKTSSREDLYKQFDSLDGKVASLQKAVPELTPNHPQLLRGAERIRALIDDLHFIVSEGDDSPERFRQVLARQGKALSDTVKKLSRTAQYVLGETSGRGELLGDMHTLVEACGRFETCVATPTELEKCRKEFSNLNEAWRSVVQGISLLPPKENVYLLRLAVRADAIHERLFRALGIKGKRVALTIRS